METTLRIQRRWILNETTTLRLLTLSFVYKLCACELGQSHPNYPSSRKRQALAGRPKIR